MSLAEHQRTALRVCFDAEPSEADLAIIGSAERWLVYRGMVRRRLQRVAKAALPRTEGALGEPRFDALLDAWFGAGGPRTPFFRAVPEEQAAFLRSHLGASDPPWADDLLRYETAQWRARYALGEPSRPVVEFAFDRAPAVNPTLELLRLGHPVQTLETDLPRERAAAAETEARADVDGALDGAAPERQPDGARAEAEREAGHRYDPEPTTVCVYRRPGEVQARTFVLNDVAAALVEAWIRGDETVTDSVRAVASRLGCVIDQVFIDDLSTMLADFLDRGLLLGAYG
ncbi:MAG: putative DNA-binding domain-containing protein [Myxococcales bacterium]|nr:putative DNA-binding domain-containing protein [Myxococcales bacterium]